MRKHISSEFHRESALFRAVAGIAMLALVVSGCAAPVNTYQVAGTAISNGTKVLVMPFMDTRTFVDGNDPHKDDLGSHARDVFAAAMRNSPIGRDSIILTPDLPRQSSSLTNAQAAEYGREHGADIVVAGQVFSYTETRAASIPPRAGMFVRVVSARDGSLLFVGDHYQAAAIPGASGGRDLQARNVSSKLIEGIAVSRDFALKNNTGRVASHGALASLAGRTEAPPANDASDGSMLDNLDPLPPPPVDLPDLDMANADAWDAQPEPPPALDLDDDFYAQDHAGGGEAADPVAAAPAAGIDPTPPPALDGSDAPDAERNAASAAAAEDEATEDDGEDLAESPVAEYDWIRDASDAARMTGDELAADLFESETPLLEESLHSPAKFNPERPEPAVQARTLPSAEPATVAETPSDGGESVPTATLAVADALPVEPTLSEWREWESAQDVAALVEAGELTVGQIDAPAQPAGTTETVGETELAEAAADVPAEGDGPVVSVPIAIEQPRSFRSADLLRAAPADDDGAIVSVASENAFGRYAPERNAVRVLVLPYHERVNKNNLIDSTGGGEVVTTLYGSQLALDPTIQVMWDASGQTSHDRLVDREEALQLGRMVNADYVVRGQVVEFRRAQSVPSFYSAVISTTLLAAQMFFAEMSGVDVATEVYRVSDGLCVMSRRDRSQQKYVVQAENTVRRLASGMAESVTAVVKDGNSSEMDPLIDSLEPVTVFNNPWS